MVRLRKGEWKLQWWDWPLCIFLGFCFLGMPYIGPFLAAAFLGFPGWVQMQNAESLNPKRYPNLRIAGLFLFALALAFFLRQSTRPDGLVHQPDQQTHSNK